jgi:hypothetical protein
MSEGVDIDRRGSAAATDMSTSCWMGYARTLRVMNELEPYELTVVEATTQTADTREVVAIHGAQHAVPLRWPVGRLGGVSEGVGTRLAVCKRQHVDAALLAFVRQEGFARRAMDPTIHARARVARCVHGALGVAP